MKCSNKNNQDADVSQKGLPSIVNLVLDKFFIPRSVFPNEVSDKNYITGRNLEIWVSGDEQIYIASSVK